MLLLRITHGDLQGYRDAAGGTQHLKLRPTPLTDQKHRHEGTARDGHGGGHSGHPELKGRAARSPTLAESSTAAAGRATLKAYLHDDEEEERDEDVDLRVFPGVVVADVFKLLGDSLAAPRAVVKQGDQGLVLRQLTGEREKASQGRSAAHSPSKECLVELHLRIKIFF